MEARMETRMEMKMRTRKVNVQCDLIVGSLHNIPKRLLSKILF